MITDGVVVIRRWQPDDIPALVAGRDDEFHRYMGEGVPDPDPFAMRHVRTKPVSAYL